MKQYEFQVVSKSGKNDSVFCTAKNMDFAKLQVKLAYTGFDIVCCKGVHAAHKYFGEIDASGMTQHDFDHLKYAC